IPTSCSTRPPASPTEVSGSGSKGSRSSWKRSCPTTSSRCWATRRSTPAPGPWCGWIPGSPPAAPVPSSRCPSSSCTASPTALSPTSTCSTRTPGPWLGWPRARRPQPPRRTTGALAWESHPHRSRGDEAGQDFLLEELEALPGARRREAAHERVEHEDCPRFLQSAGEGDAFVGCNNLVEAALPGRGDVIDGLERAHHSPAGGVGRPPAVGVELVEGMGADHVPGPVGVVGDVHEQRPAGVDDRAGLPAERPALRLVEGYEVAVVDRRVEPVGQAGGPAGGGGDPTAEDDRRTGPLRRAGRDVERHAVPLDRLALQRPHDQSGTLFDDRRPVLQAGAEHGELPRDIARTQHDLGPAAAHLV